MFELKNKRLSAIAKEVPQCRCVADIGTDHAHLPIELVMSGKCERAIACDVKKGPLEVAQKNISELALNDKIELRLGFGLEVLSPDECDCITVAGMGGLMICDILERSKTVSKSADRLFLQPNTCEYDLRKYLYENEYTVENELGVHEGEHYYLIIVCKKGGFKPFKADDNYFFMGNIMPERLNAGDRAFLNNLKEKAQRVLAGIALSDAEGASLTEANMIKKQKYEELVKELESILK